MKATYIQATITNEAAQAILMAAETRAKELGMAFSIAVSDVGGSLKMFSAMDNAPLISVQVAKDKAYTAAGWGMATHEWFDFVKNDAPLALGAPSGIDRLILIGGGYPLKVDGHTVGAIGVSGAHYRDDMKVAQAGVAAFEEMISKTN